MEVLASARRIENGLTWNSERFDTFKARGAFHKRLVPDLYSQDSREEFRVHQLIRRLPGVLVYNITLVRGTSIVQS